MLFEQASLRRDSAQSTAPGQGAAAYAEGSAGGSAGFLYGQGVKAHGIGYEEECSPIIRSCVLCQNPWDYQSKRVFDAEGMFPTLPAGNNGGQNDQAVIYDTTQITSPVNGSNP